MCSNVNDHYGVLSHDSEARSDRALYPALIYGDGAAAAIFSPPFLILADYQPGPLSFGLMPPARTGLLRRDNKACKPRRRRP